MVALTLEFGLGVRRGHHINAERQRHLQSALGNVWQYKSDEYLVPDLASSHSMNSAICISG